MKISRGVKAKPRNILLYGEHGTGKTTLAASFPRPHLFDIEGGSGDLDIDRSEDFASYAEFEEQISVVLHDGKTGTAVIDTVDWLERLLQFQVSARGGKDSIEDFGYGKGYKLAAEEFEKTYINHLRAFNRNGIATVSICHAKSVKHSPPDGTSFDRWEPDLHDKIQSPLIEFCDEVFFLKKKTFTKKEDLGFNKERSIVIGTEERILVTSDTGSVVAKNRLQMPNEITATFDAYAQYIQTARSRGGNIEGIVVNGSSKPAKTEAQLELETTKVF